MTLQDIIQKLNLTVLTEEKDFKGMAPVSGYASDLLSCVMVGAEKGGLWVTLQAHANIVAIGALLDLCAIILTEDAQPDPEVLLKANEEGVTLLSTPMPTYKAVGMLWSLGLKNNG